MKSPAPWHVETIGSTGTPLVWLHGWGYDHKGLGRIAALFEARNINQLYDLPGFGQTPMMHEGASTSDYADRLVELSPKDQKSVLIGHSYGGRIAVQYAAKYPDRVSAIVLIAGAGLQRKRSLSFKIKASYLRMIGRLARLSDRIVKTNLREAYTARFGSADYKNAGPLRATLVSAVTENLTAEAANVKCPVLLIYGAEDTDAPPEIGKHYAKLMQKARFVELAGYDHHDILQRGAYQCEALIKSFLKEIPDA
ncbi:MAG: hypothetical protein COB37_03505 [Kordiimonadales bacterium]|nr:MAG: hypothetical protein COB37_03505 [Kordiimonadales bacterium]